MCLSAATDFCLWFYTHHEKHSRIQSQWWSPEPLPSTTCCRPKDDSQLVLGSDHSIFTWFWWLSEEIGNLGSCKRIFANLWNLLFAVSHNFLNRDWAFSVANLSLPAADCKMCMEGMGIFQLHVPDHPIIFFLFLLPTSGLYLASLHISVSGFFAGSSV